MQMSRTPLAGIFLSAAIAFAGCSSGGYGTSPGDSYPYASIPTPGTASVVLSSEMQTFPLPTSAGYGGTLQFARATSGVGASVNVGAVDRFVTRGSLAPSSSITSSGG